MTYYIVKRKKDKRWSCVEWPHDYEPEFKRGWEHKGPFKSSFDALVYHCRYNTIKPENNINSKARN